MNFLSMLSRIARLTADASTTETPVANPTSTLIFQVILIGGVLIFFYFVLIRPQKKKEKEEADMRNNIQIGDEITTIGGIVGIVVRKNEDTVVIETGGDRSKLRIKLWAIRENATVHEMIESASAKKTKSKESKEDDAE